jgi:hypothetical protein
MIMMGKRYGLITVIAVFAYLCVVHTVSADSITRFNFTQPNFTGGAGNSLFDVAVVEKRGGGDYLKNQGESLELDVERKKVQLENDKAILESNQLKLQGLTTNSAGTSTSGNSDDSAETVYNVETLYQNIVTGEQLYFTNEGEVYRNVMEKNDLKEVTDVEIDNTGNLTYNQDGVTKQIESGEYNDIDIAAGTGNVEQNPTSNMNILIESGN